MDEPSRQQIVDGEHLKMLRIGYLVSAGTTAFFGLFGFMYVFMGVMFTNMTFEDGKGPPAFFGWFFAIFGLVFIVFGLGLAVLKVYVASCIKKRRSRILCLVVAGITCLAMPYGTLLGVLTFVVLSRPTVSQLFDGEGVFKGEA
jgi:hypothetical protein